VGLCTKGEIVEVRTFVFREPEGARNGVDDFD
jgi:hypothetical protein